MWKRVSKRLRKIKGQGLVEYALIIGLVALAVIAALTSFGVSLNTMFNNVVAAF